MLGVVPQTAFSVLQTHLHGSLLHCIQISKQILVLTVAFADHLMGNSHLYSSAATNCYIFLRCSLLPDVRMYVCWGTWVAQLVKHPTLNFSSGHDLRVCGFEPRIGLCADSAEPAWDSLSLPLSLPLPCLLSLSLKIHTLKKKRTYVCLSIYSLSALLESNKRAGLDLSVCYYIHSACLIVGAQGTFSESTVIAEGLTLESDRPRPFCVSWISEPQ